MVQKRKLIEVALPLEAISRASQTEKNRKVGKPQNLHHWWSRKPITSARALLLAQLINDPSSEPERFVGAEAIAQERERRHRLLARAVEWDEVSAPSGNLQRELASLLPENITVVDPFVGGGSLVLAAAQFGVNTRSSDLNPVAVLLTKALVEIPSRFVGVGPVSPDVRESKLGRWSAAQGLAADTEAYGDWMRREATDRIGMHYPKSNGRSVLAWVWSRTVTCQNPACAIEMPLASKWWLSKKRGKETFVVPTVVRDGSHPSGKRIKYTVERNPAGPAIDPPMSGKAGAVCVACSATASKDYIKSEGAAGRMGMALMAVVAEGDRTRLYYDANADDALAADVDRPDDVPEYELGHDPRNLWTPPYGLATFADLFTDRQLLAMATLSDLVDEARQRVLADALAAGMPVGATLSEGGRDATAYADAIAVYLALSVSRLADWSNALCSWEATGEVSQHLFTGQSIPMAWDVSEANVLGDGNSGSFSACLRSIVAPLKSSAIGGKHSVEQSDARKSPLAGAVVVTDPPYFDNISYADLSDFFYVWQRRTLANILPSIFGTVLVPKATELVANPYRAGGVEEASNGFMDGFRDVFEEIRTQADSEFPLVVYYASKSVEKNALGGGNSRWATILQAMVDSGWQVVRTWPLRTENASRAVAQGSNSLSTSTVLVLRPRPSTASATDRSGFLAALKGELDAALQDLQAGGVAPVDLPQAAIGPGIEVFSRYSVVREADGTAMSVRSALARINEVLDETLNEQEGDFDDSSRFAIAWYRQHGYGVGKFGDADNLARARNTSVDVMDREGILTSKAGSVQLIRPSDLIWDYDPVADQRTSNWEGLHHLIKVLERDGIAPAGDFLRAAISRPDRAVDPDLVVELAHLVFRIAEDSGWTKDALSFNNLVTSWPEINEVARTSKKSAQTQGAFEFDEDE